jgi:hypothetical protein
MKTLKRVAQLSAVVLAAACGMPVAAQVPVDAASDRRAGDYAYFQSFGKPDVPFEDLEDVAQVRSNSSKYFESDLATCDTTKATCDADNVYELADRFCQALEFDGAVTWRVSRDDDELRLHWAVCGLKK